jgi:hypothetical protein
MHLTYLHLHTVVKLFLTSHDLFTTLTSRPPALVLKTGGHSSYSVSAPHEVVAPPHFAGGSRVVSRRTNQ